MSTVLITSHEEFLEHRDALFSAPWIAIDTEFFRETTYFPKLGLVQVSNEAITACIDPLAYDAVGDLSELLLDPSITKVFHSCSQDLEVLHHHIGTTPAPVTDTQIAAALVGHPAQIGYARLVESLLEITLDKSQTRTDWLRRPLSKKQIDYAADDVVHLRQLVPMLEAELEARGRLEWYREECDALQSVYADPLPSMEHCLNRVKGTNRMEPRDLAIVDAIARWREQQAIATDKTRKRVLADEDVIEIAVRKPGSVDELMQIGDVGRRLDASDAEKLMAELSRSYVLDETEWPNPPREMLDPAQKKQLKRYQSIVDEVATEYDLPSAILCSKKELLRFMDGGRKERFLSGWRKEIIGKRLLREVQKGD